MIERKIYIYFLSFVLLFNWSLFRENFELDYILGIKILLSLIIPFFGMVIIFFIKPKNNYLISNIFLFLFFYFFIDQNILPLKSPIFEKIGLNLFFTVILMSLLLFVLFYFKKLRIFFYLFAVFFSISNLASGVFYYLERNQTAEYKYSLNKKNLFVNKSNKNGLIILFLDEIGGIDEIAARDLYNQNIASNVYKILNKYDFQYGKNIYSTFSHTKIVHAGILNNLDPIIFNKISDFENLFKRHYGYVSLKKNLFFDSWNGDIDVFQSEHINFCNHNKVKDCVTDRSTQLRDLIFHLYNKERLLSYLILRAIYYTDTKLINTNEDFYVKYSRSPDKKNFKKNLDDIFDKLKISKETDTKKLIFYHAMTPHGPYSFKKDCSHGYIDEAKITIDERIFQHALEVNCVFKTVDFFLENLEKENLLKKYDVIILGDHGSRISTSIKHKHQTFFAVKTETIVDKNTLNNNTIQNIFPKVINPNYKSLFKKIVVPDVVSGASLIIPF